MKLHIPAGEVRITDPILIKDAMDEFGRARNWFLRRIALGEIRAKKIVHNLVLERSDIERLVASPSDLKLLAQAQQRGKKKKP